LANENKLVDRSRKKRTHTTPKRVKSSNVRCAAYIISVANKAKIILGHSRTRRHERDKTIIGISTSAAVSTSLKKQIYLLSVLLSIASHHYPNLLHKPTSLKLSITSILSSVCRNILYGEPSHLQKTIFFLYSAF
jgi:hypothetical protein